MLCPFWHILSFTNCINVHIILILDNHLNLNEYSMCYLCLDIAFEHLI